MYTASGRERLVIAADYPEIGLPSEPLLIAREHRAVLAYKIAANNSQDWRPEAQFDLGGAGEAFALVALASPSQLLWTPYSQEGLGRHPLGNAGLTPFSITRVGNSPLIKPHPVLVRQHMIFQFEDSTLDAVFEAAVLYRYYCEWPVLPRKIAELLDAADA